jgi:hypothetical protein
MVSRILGDGGFFRANGYPPAMGLVAFGTWWFGETDAVEGLGAVRTRFFHVMAIPLVPRDSLWVTRASWSFRGGAVIEGKPIPLQWKSVILGYLRGWGTAAALVGVLLARDHPDVRTAYVGVAIVGAATAAVAFLPWWRRAGPAAEARWRASLADS